ncbi:hypothetical protein N0M98_22365 [Paenibacillus doosanensis]|uniref:hypothetical protein n=1 Tax=Paenibacillus doosanensis TaxID=1229154 RepID=UPI00217F433C|nr:hypothetical protein [Paenibacillus doosanensis]MCS7462873.1 hypothetical protein [Paenibacillus doosanensis]
MENLVSTIMFVLPGFMMYFWVQTMGINPVVKHSTIEFGALSALAWFPVAFTSLEIMKLCHWSIRTLDDLKSAAINVSFLMEFLVISVIVSFILSIIYAKWLYTAQSWAVNKIRISINKAKLSNSPSVWEEVFLNHETQVVGIAKLGSKIPDIIGCIEKVSRPFEQKRGFKLIYVEHCTKIVQQYNVPISSVFTDIDSGVNVFIYDLDAYNESDANYREEGCPDMDILDKIIIS